MKRFNFSLEKVLKLRKYREEEARIELGRAVGVLAQIENNIKKTAVIRSNAARQRFDTGNAGYGLPAMQSWENYINWLDRETERLLREAAQAELIVQEKRESYLAASRDLKVMDKLKEIREKEYGREMRAGETRELDDIFRHKGAELAL